MTTSHHAASSRPNTHAASVTQHTAPCPPRRANGAPLPPRTPPPARARTNTRHLPFTQPSRRAHAHVQRRRP
eukprot:4485745-Prorocentrum_lima.AAC.1